MSLVFYAIGLVTGLVACWCYRRHIQQPQEEPWITVNGQAFDDLEAACEFSDWLETHGREIKFCVRKMEGVTDD